MGIRMKIVLTGTMVIVTMYGAAMTYVVIDQKRVDKKFWEIVKVEF